MAPGKLAEGVPMARPWPQQKASPAAVSAHASALPPPTATKPAGVGTTTLAMPVCASAVALIVAVPAWIAVACANGEALAPATTLTTLALFELHTIGRRNTRAPEAARVSAQSETAPPTTRVDESGVTTREAIPTPLEAANCTLPAGGGLLPHLPRPVSCVARTPTITVSLQIV